MLTKMNFGGKYVSFVKSLIYHKLHEQFFSHGREGGIADEDGDLGVFTPKFMQSFGNLLKKIGLRFGKSSLLVAGLCCF